MTSSAKIDCTAMLSQSLMLSLNSKWKDVTDVMDKLTHLNLHHDADLLKVLQSNCKMFDDTLGTYPHLKVHIELLPDANSMHS